MAGTITDFKPVQEVTTDFSPVAEVKGAGLAKPNPSPEESVPEWGRNHPNLYGAAGATKSVVSPLLQTLGLLGGGSVGAGAGPGGAVAGAGLGYAGAERINKIISQALGEASPETIPQAFKNTGKDVVTGSATEAGGQIAGKGIQQLIKAIPRSVEENMYERVMKPSTALKQTERMKRVNTALNEGIPVTKKGVEKSRQIILDINKEIQGRIDEYAAQGATVDASKVVNNAGNKILDKIVGKEPLPDTPLNQSVSVLKEFESNAPRNLPIRTAQDYKQSFNKQLDDFYKAIQHSPDKTKVIESAWTNKTKAALADELRNEITNIFPEVKALNQREASLIQLNKSLERSVNRISQHDILSLKGIIGAMESPKLFFVNYILNNPTVQSKLAVALRQARMKPEVDAYKSVAPYVGRGLGYLIGKGSQNAGTP